MNAFQRNLLLSQVVKFYGPGQKVDHNLLDSYIKEAVAKSVVPRAKTG